MCGLDEAVGAIHKRFTYRMHDLGEFMKGLLQCYTQWHNRTHSRTGRLCEDRFKSLIVEDGVAEGISKEEAELEKKKDGEIPFGKMLRCRVRYFTDGAVIGSKEFVNEAYANARERFGPKRKDGARKLRGEASAAAWMLWSFRDLRKGI
jgi:hypothetical protein